MKNIWKNNSWFSIVIAMALTIFIWLAAIYLLEYIIPFGRNVKGVENASVSYYQAASWIEDAFWYINQNNIGDEFDEIMSTSENIDYGYDMTSNGSQIPLPWKWNNQFDADWNLTTIPNFNRLSRSNPIQLEVWNNMISSWTSVDFYIRTPNTTGTSSPYSLANSTNSIINWQLSTPNKTLNSRDTNPANPDSTITSAQINSSAPISLASRNGVDLENNNLRFSEFYDNECTSWVSCVLKLSVIGNLIASSNDSVIPYLEYRIDFWSDIVPLRFVQIDAVWKSNGFSKNLNVSVPQLTVDEAFDFTILQ